MEELPEVATHTFVVKVWIEDVDEITGKVIWRGHVTNVMSGERRYFTDPAKITEIITSYFPEYLENSSLISRILKIFSK